MKNTALFFLISLLSLCFSAARPAFSTPMASLSDAALSEAGAINFDSETTGLLLLWTIGDVAFRTTDNNFTIASRSVAQYLNSGESGRSETCEVSNFPLPRISLPNGADASDVIWDALPARRDEIKAYNFGNNLLAACRLPGVNSLDGGDGGDTGFTTRGYDYLIKASDNYDWMFTVLTLYGCDVARGAFQRLC